MGEYFAGNYTGEPFKLFGAAHLTMLALIALFTFWLIRSAMQTDERTRRVQRYALAVVVLLNELAWHLWHWYIGVWSVEIMLPFHLCSVLVYLSAFVLITKNYTGYEFIYFMGLAGAAQALITPDAGIYGFPHFRFFQLFVSHGIIVITALYMTFVYHYRPTWQSLARVLIGMNIYMVFVGLLNWRLGSNYMFIAHKPYTPSLIDFLGPWPWYIVSLEALAVILCVLLYLPFALKDRKNRAEPVTA